MRSIFKPLRVTYRNRKGAEISDGDLLRAWSHLSDEHVEERAAWGDDVARRVMSLRHPTPNTEA